MLETVQWLVYTVALLFNIDLYSEVLGGTKSSDEYMYKAESLVAPI